MKVRRLCLLAAGGLLGAGSALAACQVSTGGPEGPAQAGCGSFSEIHALADADVLLGQAAVMARLGAQAVGGADSPLLGRYPQADAPSEGAFGAQQPARTVAQIVPPPAPEPAGVLASLAALATLGVVLRRRKRAEAEPGAAAAVG
jgi:hypothetical protein